MPLAPDLIQHFREVLLDRRHALIGQVESLVDDIASSTESAERSKSPIDSAENASDTFEQDFAFLTMESEEELVHRIDAALLRMKEGTFGQCDECGEEIPNERLEFIPFADLCLECQQQEELTGSRKRSDDFDIPDDITESNSAGDDS